MDKTKKIFLEIILFYIFLFLPLLFSPFSYSILLPKDILLTIGVIFFVSFYFFQDEIRIKKITLFFLIFILYLFLSSILSKYRFAGNYILNVLIINLIFFVFYTNYNYLNTKKILECFVILFIPVAFIGILQVFRIDFLHGLLVFGKNIPATFGNPNFFAAFIIGIIPVLYMLFKESKDYKKYFYFSLMLIFIFLLFKTGSKAGILTFFIEFFLFLLLSDLNERNKSIIIFFTFFIFFIVILWNFKIPLEKVLNKDEWLKNESIFFRINIWKGTGELIKNNFLTGTGPGSFAFVFPFFRPEKIMFWAKEHSYEIVYPENIFLQIMAETGVMGFLFFLIFLVLLYKNYNLQNKYFFISLTGILFLNLFAVDLNYTTTIFLFAFFMGNIFLKKETDFFILKNKKKNLILIFVILIMFYILFSQFKNFISDAYLKNAIHFSQKTDWEYAIINYKNALKINPDNIVAQYFLANAYFDSNKILNALSEFEKLEQKVPGYILINYKKANIFNKLGNIEKAKEEYEKAIKLDPYLKEALSELAFIYYNAKNYLKAEELIKKALEKYNDASLYNNLGNIYFSAGKSKEAIESFKKAIELKKDKDYYYNLGCVYFTLKDYKNAKENIRKAKSLNIVNDEKIINMLKIIERYDKINKDVN